MSQVEAASSDVKAREEAVEARQVEVAAQAADIEMRSKRLQVQFTFSVRSEVPAGLLGQKHLSMLSK